jgi:beta-lactamase superfamily II metal-dependent hydrolase
MNKLTIEMLPAGEGDCLLVSWDDGPRKRHMLIDGGRAGTYKALKKRLLALPEIEREFELLVVTHVDRDHIEGVLKLLADPKRPVTFKDVWFNGYDHLINAQKFGPEQGELLTPILKKSKCWNVAFNGKGIRVPNAGLDKPIKLPGKMKLTIISPDQDKMLAMAPVWKAECEAAGITAKKIKPAKDNGTVEKFGAINVETLAAALFEDDTAEANGSSIGFLAEYDGKRVLFAADCHVDRLIDSVDRLEPDPTKKLQLDAFKVAHHGSEYNVSDELLKRLDCTRYLVSTSGAYFQHPTRSAIARILKFGGKKKKQLFFNYKSKFNKVWAAPALCEKYKYEAHFPEKGSDGTLVVEL